MQCMVSFVKPLEIAIKRDKEEILLAVFTMIVIVQNCLTKIGG